ncbi:hypothetical protein PN36_12305 [Candidatus Thiomargarita nelsonii]|uniref:Uncharacterized protein n=1 Tax=Candidatus Thiomargarita nelsonii TaxID=1003181 RepID=A0A0A6RNV0_9GAMM|nr:hypothetical protein PN36_12305 [Candidatus Thiomargarita nelsonii]
MNNKIILETIDDVLNRLDSMSDEELQAKYENHKSGPIGRVFLESEDFFAFLMNQSVEEHIAPVNDLSIEYYIRQTIETHGKLIEQFKQVINDDVYILAV